MHGFVKFPDGFPAARIQLEWEHYPKVAEGFMRRANRTSRTTGRSRFAEVGVSDRVAAMKAVVASRSVD